MNSELRLQTSKWTLKATEPNRFGVCLIDASHLHDSEVDPLFDAFMQLSQRKTSTTLVVPGHWSLPKGLCQVARSDAIIDETGSETTFTRDCCVVVADQSKVPHALNGAKAAAHVSLTVNTALPISIATWMKEKRGLPLRPYEFIAATSGAMDGYMEEVHLLVCARSGATATEQAFAHTYTDFGGSADVVVDPTGEKRLETTQEILFRETEEEGGALVELLAVVKENPQTHDTPIQIGGPFKIVVNDYYSKCVSQRAIELSELRDILDRARGDGEEVVDFGVVLLPDLKPDIDEAEIRAQLVDWFKDCTADERKGLLRICKKVYDSVGYPVQWHARPYI